MNLLSLVVACCELWIVTQRISLFLFFVKYKKNMKLNFCGDIRDIKHLKTEFVIVSKTGKEIAKCVNFISGHFNLLEIVAYLDKRRLDE